ncbi:MAG TPA: lysylphosphatidylglycerol synthase transmembrane domain-containing protein [Gaiellaceae bacterium]|nr:lysylphosphatidylglycerol synthase transmembrane domain-containing protein [Gaiellaceae bacterium]
MADDSRPAEIPTKASPIRTRRRQLVGGGIALVVIVATFFFVLPRIADYRDVWDVVQALTWQEVVALALAAVVNVLTYAPPWQAALPGLRFRQAFVVTQASTASTYVAPGGFAPGMAVSALMLRGWGFSGRPVTLAVTVTGVWNQLVIFGFPVIALGLLTAEGGGHPLLRTMALVGAAVLGAVITGVVVGFWSAALARKVGDLAARSVSWLMKLVRRKPVRWGGESFVHFRRETMGLLRRRWHVLTLATLAGHLSVFAVLLVCLRVFDVPASEVDWIEAFAAWSVVRVLGSLPVTPGGLGIVELGLTSLLVGFGGGQAEVVAAVLVYRFLTMVPTLVLGLAAAVTWRHHHPEADRGR